MKKGFCTILALAVALSLVGCGSAAQPSSRDYGEVLLQCQADSSNTPIPIVTSPEQDEFGLMELYDLDPSKMQRYALCISPINLNAYALMIVLPTQDGRADIEKAMAGYIEKQTQAFKDYLPDQYAIAQDAKLITTQGGELILVMCQNAFDMLHTIETALKA